MGRSMKYKTHIHSTVPCPDCTHPNLVKFYVLNLLSAGTCEHCEREVEFRQPSELRMPK